MRATRRSYYDHLPESQHQPGDIWSGLPTQGLLPGTVATGIVISPACDLQNRKAETVTYLPIISATTFLTGRLFRRDLAIEAKSKLKTLEDRLPQPRDTTWSDDTLRQVRRDVEALGTDLPKAKRRTATSLMHLLFIIEAIDTGSTVEFEDIKSAFTPRAWEGVCERLVANGRAEMHFLPRDGMDPEWSAVPQHSVVLFRYPITLPIECLDCALDMSVRDWEQCVGSLRKKYTCAGLLSDQRPMKRARLQGPYTSDLLTRYVSLYVRLGSPDFSQGIRRRYAGEIGECEL